MQITINWDWIIYIDLGGNLIKSNEVIILNYVAAIIVTYNRKKMLQENIEALLNQNFKKFDIYIIDNNSSDGTDKLLLQYKNNKRIKYINTQANLGGAGGFSFGIKTALEKQKYRYVWIMDDDTIPSVTSLSSLVDSAKKLGDNFSFICSYVKWIDNSPCKMNMPLISKKWYEEADKLNYGLLKMDSCTFVSVLVNSELILKCGLPVRQMFIYGDDHEFTARLSKVKAGYLNFDSIVLHKMPTNTGFDLVNIPKDKISRYFYDSRNRFYRAKKSGLKDVLIYLIWIPYISVKIIFKAKDSKLKRIGVILKGFFCGLFFNPKIEKIMHGS
jgi:GT2 family glycosyltransferase